MFRSRCTTLCDKVYQRLATGQRFSPATPVSSTNKTYRQDIADILLKMALNPIKQTRERMKQTKPFVDTPVFSVRSVLFIALVFCGVFIYFVCIRSVYDAQCCVSVDYPLVIAPSLFSYVFCLLTYNQ
jgi:hypothetical protein